MNKSRANKYTPKTEILDHFPEISGNTVNGVGEKEPRRPSPFFWHPPDRQTHGELQQYLVNNLRPASGEDHSFRNPAVDRGPARIPVARTRTEKFPEQWVREVKEFVLSDEGDLVGITPLLDDYVYEGYHVNEPWVILIGVAHDYEKLSKVPGTPEDLTGYHEIHDQYNRAARAAARLTNLLRGYGYQAKDYPGPMADALNMIPAALAAGLGELGKHGSIINRRYGSGFRLAAVTTDVPLLADQPDAFGADEFCHACQLCRHACPPDAIHREKVLVRGVKKWYVDFDKCIPYFVKTYGCAICIEVCPWSESGRGEWLSEKMLARRNKSQG